MPYLEMHRQVIVRWSGLRVDAVIVSCAISAGIHGALAPEHFREATAAGAGFVVATVVLAALAVALTHCPASRIALVAAAATMLALIVSYGLAVTTGLPVLHPEVEPLDGLALFTKAVEVAGLVAASSLLGRASLVLSQPKGQLT
jgi:hypothetical protein